MSHRHNRDAPTKGRRIHATDEEWSFVQAAAAKAHLSASAYVVQIAQRGGGAVRDAHLADVLRLLTACHGLLAEIADRNLRDRDTDAAILASELTDVAALLEAFLITATECPRAERGSTFC